MTRRRHNPGAGRRRQRRAFVDDLVASVGAVFALTPEQIRGRRRQGAIVAARHAACLLAWQLSGLSFPVIGRQIGGREHSTVIHSCDTCIDMMRGDPAYRANVVRAARLALSGRALIAATLARIEAERMPPPEPAEPIKPAAPAELLPDWWELSDDEMIEHRIAAHRAAGGDFVEVFS